MELLYFFMATKLTGHNQLKYYIWYFPCHCQFLLLKFPSPTWENSLTIFSLMFNEGFGEVGGKILKVIIFSKFWGCRLLCFGICFDTWLVILEGNDMIFFLQIQSKYSSLCTHWDTSYMSKSFIVLVIQKPKKW